tara:strand:+ start:567 stop:1034 length:468 start_codon:yes stop_codon:yes gene_type:complete
MDILTPKKIEFYCEFLAKHLLDDKNWQPLVRSKEWYGKVPNAAGIYAILESGNIVYIGETACLRARTRDLLSTYNHTFRRKFGVERFAGEEGFILATSRKKFPVHIEDMIDESYKNLLRISYMPVAFGRKEVETMLISKFQPAYNQSFKRGKVKD